jgi:hypothetical protein
MHIKLLRKFALVINDVDLTHISVGDVVDLDPRDAFLLIAEGWAELVDAESESEARDADVGASEGMAS